MSNTRTYGFFLTAALCLAACGDLPERCQQRPVPSQSGEVVTQLGFTVLGATPGAAPNDRAEFQTRVDQATQTRSGHLPGLRWLSFVRLRYLRGCRASA